MHQSNRKISPVARQSGKYAVIPNTGNVCNNVLRKQPSRTWISNSFLPGELKISETTSETSPDFKTSSSNVKCFNSRSCLSKRHSDEVETTGPTAESSFASEVIYMPVAAKRLKPDEKGLNDSDCLYDSFNNSNSILQSIDFDQLDACVTEAIKTENSRTVDSFIPENIPSLNHEARSLASQLTNDDVKNDCFQKEKTIAKQTGKLGESKIRSSDVSDSICEDGKLNILQAIDISASVLSPSVSAHDVDKSKESSKVSAVVASRRRISSFADQIRRTLAANAKLDTPIRIRHVASAVEDRGEDSDVNSVGRKRLSDYPQNTFYGLPLKVEELLKEHRNISTLYDWQKECLSLGAVCDGSNLIYSLPTSGGKTLVAEMLILRQILCRKRNAVLILPFVAIVQEKVRTLAPFGIELEFFVEEYAASKGPIPPRHHRSKNSLYVATIEKANSLINSLIENKRIDSVGLVVVDELHMLGEGGSRGATLEMTLTKVMHSNPCTQIVGMSATLSNIKDIQKFLNAEIYTNNFRPVELKEFVKLADTIYEVDGAALDPDDCLKFSRVTTFKYDREMIASDPDHLAGLVLEIVPNNSCLVFCPTKKNCENVAQLLCRMFPKELREVKSRERRMLYDLLKLEGGGVVCPILCATISYGVAYHHSGLTNDERKLIEEAYLDGTLCVLACTSTLAAGVNLPARRVILRSPYVGRSFISRSQYKQMIGRAGRAGIDTVGESILLVASAADRRKLPDLIGGSYDRCISSLFYEGNKGIRSLLLSTIGLKITNSVSDLVAFMSRTLCHVQSCSLNVSLTDVTQKALQQLIEIGLVKQLKSTSETPNGSIEVTDLGRAVFKGAIDVDYGKKLHADLSSAQQSVVLANYLHLLYLVTPYDMVDVSQTPNWMTYFGELGSLSASEMKVASLVGISENHVAKKAAGQTIRQQVDEFAVARFYLTLILYSLWRQKTVWNVSTRFGVSRGFIQQLLTSASSFGSCVSYFCQELEEFWAYQDLLTNFVRKLSFCCALELVPLLEIPGVKMGRAKQLLRAGYKNLQQVAYADPDSLVRQIEHLPHRLAKQIVSCAQMMLTEKAEAMLAEVDDMIALPPLDTAATIITNL